MKNLLEVHKENPLFISLIKLRRVSQFTFPDKFSQIALFSDFFPQRKQKPKASECRLIATNFTYKVENLKFHMLFCFPPAIFDFRFHFQPQSPVGRRPVEMKVSLETLVGTAGVPDASPDKTQSVFLNRVREVLKGSSGKHMIFAQKQPVLKLDHRPNVTRFTILISFMTRQVRKRGRRFVGDYFTFVNLLKQFLPYKLVQRNNLANLNGKCKCIFVRR